MTERKYAPNESQGHLYIVPIHLYIRQLEQLANKYEWDGELDKCDLTLFELNHVRQYQIDTGSLYYPLF